MGKHWTPFQMQIVIWHAVSYAPFPGHDAPQYGEEIAWLVRIGVLEIGGNDRSFKTTPLGAALVDMWRATPLPVAVFRDPRFEAPQ
jgi:hypothetical protein